MGRYRSQIRRAVAGVSSGPRLFLSQQLLLENVVVFLREFPLVPIKVSVADVLDECLPVFMALCDIAVSKHTVTVLIAAYQESVQIIGASGQFDQGIIKQYDISQMTKDAVKGAGAKPKWFIDEEQVKADQEPMNKLRVWPPWRKLYRAARLLVGKWLMQRSKCSRRGWYEGKRTGRIRRGCRDGDPRIDGGQR